MQKAKKRMLNNCKRRKTYHGYPTKLSNIVSDLGDNLGVTPEGTFSSEQSELLSSSQPSNLETVVCISVYSNSVLNALRMNK